MYARTLSLFAALSSGLLLTGCSQEPTQAELTQLMEQQTASLNTLTTGLAGLSSMNLEGLEIKLDELKKLGCKKLPNQATTSCECEASITITAPIAGKVTSIESLTVSKTDNGWVLR